MLPGYKKNYISLTHTLQEIKRASIAGLPFCSNFVPSMLNRDPEGLFYFLRQKTTYKKDPPGVELLQQPETLMTKKNFWGIPGAGDCDCFSILGLSCLAVIGQKNLKVVLVGKNRTNPTHIYIGFGNGKNYKPFDLTNNFFNYERDYKFRQILDFNF
jgi:hypothetical protein